MSDSIAKNMLSVITFKRAVWLAPAAYFVHIVEEASFGFHSFVNSNICAAMSFNKFIVVNTIIMLVYIVLSALYSLRPNRVTALPFLVLVLSAQLANAFLHLVLTVWFGQFCAGLISGLALYVPLSCVILYQANQERYVDKKTSAALVMAGFVFMGLFFLVSMFGTRVLSGELALL